MKRLNSMRSALLVVGVIVTFGCASTFAANGEEQAKPRSYLELSASGKLSIVPYVWEREAHGKHVAVIGTRHRYDPRSPMYDRIEAIFKRIQPQLVLHENVAPEDLAVEPRDQAIRRAADLGFAVYLAHRYGVSVQSADAPVKEEIKALLARYPAEDVFVFLTAQRLIGSERNPDLKANAVEYPGFLENYLIQNGLPRKKDWEAWGGFLKEYKRVVGHPLIGKSWNPDLLSPIRNASRLNQVARTSDEFRDHYLLVTIKMALQKYDRVVVIFGGWHVLALEPELDGMLKN